MDNRPVIEYIAKYYVAKHHTGYFGITLDHVLNDHYKNVSDQAMELFSHAANRQFLIPIPEVQMVTPRMVGTILNELVRHAIMNLGTESGRVRAIDFLNVICTSEIVENFIDAQP